MKLDEAYKIFDEIQRSISKLEDRYGHLPEEFEFNYENKEDKYKHDIARSIVYNLDKIQRILKWVNKPIIAEGTLIKNENERYEVNGIELSSGYPLDVWDAKWEQWDYSRMEHNGEDYYIVSLGKDKKIDGVLVRLRK